MRFLTIPEVVQLSTRLSDINAGKTKIYSRVELYDCNDKNNDDKVLFQSLNRQYDKLSSSPLFRRDLSISPFGSLLEPDPRNTFITLISALNTVFPDYDFSSVQAEHFVNGPNLRSIIEYVNSVLGPVVPDYDEFSTKLWMTLDQEMCLHDCEIYSYVAPEPESDPFNEEANLWCLNYFFYNRKVKRVLFFMSRSVNQEFSANNEDYHSDGDTFDDENEWDMDFDRMDF